MQRKLPHFTALTLSIVTAVLAAVALAVALGNRGSTSTVQRAAPTASTVPTSSGSSSSTNANSVYDSAYRGVVKITTDGGEGTGIVLDGNGDILTNDHVVSGARSVKVTSSSSATRSATVLGTDPGDDLAVVKVNPSGLNLQPLTLGDSSAAKVGDTVYALGNPFGYTDSFSEGIVSGLGRSITAPNGFTIGSAIQTDAAINPGNSGGPLLNTRGEVIGINAQIASSGVTAGGQGQNNGVGFAIPVNTAKAVIPQLEKGGRLSHAYLGVSMSDGAQPGAVVASVQSDGPAAKAGLRQGDVIRSIDGKAINASGDVAAVIASHRPGDKVTIGIARGGKSQSLTVTLGSQPSSVPGNGGFGQP